LHLDAVVRERPEEPGVRDAGVARSADLGHADEAVEVEDRRRLVGEVRVPGRQRQGL
jgi:hypothetical protein